MVRFSRERGVMRPGAERLQHFIAETSGYSALESPVILVTGTNGKGTVAALLESIFRAAGETTGLYTSPHLVRVEERIRVNGLPISGNRFSEICDDLERKASAILPDLTQFELLTAAAIFYFRDQKCSISIFEIGLGGHLDSTNALAPILSVLTSVGLDHAEILGDSTEDIAADKAHISRRNRPFILGPLDAEARRGALRTAKKTGARPVDADVELGEELEELLETAIAKTTPWLKANRINARVALTAIQEWERETGVRLGGEAILKGLLETFWPGRLDLRRFDGRSILFDAAHNLAGARFLREQLNLLRSGFCFEATLYASLSDKKWEEILPLIAAISKTIILSELPGERRVSAERLVSVLPASLQKRVCCESNLEGAIARLLAHKGRAPLLVTGSIALLGEVMEVLSLDPLDAKTRIMSWSDIF